MMRTRCRRGHEIAGANEYVRPSGVRQCLICLKAARDKSNERRALRTIAERARSRPPRATLQLYDIPRPGSPHPVRARSMVNTYDVEQAQRLDCVRRAECLDYTARAEWRSFSCQHCKAFAPYPKAISPVRYLSAHGAATGTG